MPKQSLDLSTALVSTLWGFSQGLVTAAPAQIIPATACAQVQNIYGFQGQLRPRAGWTAAFAAPDGANDVYGIYQHVALNGTRTTVAMTLNDGTGAVKFWEWTGAAWVDRTGGAALTGYEIAPYQPTFANLKGVLYFTTGNQPMYSFTPGGNIAVVTNGDPTIAPFENPKILLCWNGGRLFMFNCGDAPSASNPVPARVAWCDFLLPNVWQGGLNGGSSGYQDLYYGDDASDGITAAMEFANYLLVFKAHSMYQGIATNDSRFFDFTPLFRDIGCVAQNTLRRLTETAFWLGYDNVYMMQGLQQPTPIGDAIRTHIQAVSYNAQLAFSNAWIDPIKQLYHLWLPGGGGFPNVLFTYNIREQSWWESNFANTGIAPVCAMNVYDFPLNVSTYCGSRDGSIYKFDPAATDDAGTKFTGQWTSKLFDAQSLFKGLSTYAQGLAEFETFHIQKIAPLAASGKVKVQLRHGPSLDELRTTDVKAIDFKGAPSAKFVTFDKGDRFVQIILTWTDIPNAAFIEGLTQHIMPRGSVR